MAFFSGRSCAGCHHWRQPGEYSRTQWTKGDGFSRCMTCVGANVAPYRPYHPILTPASPPSPPPSYYMMCAVATHPPQPPPMPSYMCGECQRTFNDQNQLNMHMQVHRTRLKPCVACGSRFKSSANMVQHLESGYCTRCTGRDNARDQIYGLAIKLRGMRPYMTGTPLLTNGYNQGIPDYPYQCPQCSISFRQLSQLMQHQDNKHNNVRMLRY